MPQHTFEGSGPPASTPTVNGAHYTDTLNGDAYISTGTSSAADWKLLDVATAVGVNVTIDSYLVPNGVLVGSPGDMYKSAEDLGGDGSLWFKISGVATNTGWGT